MHVHDTTDISVANQKDSTHGGSRVFERPEEVEMTEQGLVLTVITLLVFTFASMFP